MLFNDTSAQFIHYGPKRDSVISVAESWKIEWKAIRIKTEESEKVRVKQDRKGDKGGERKNGKYYMISVRGGPLLVPSSEKSNSKLLKNKRRGG